MARLIPREHSATGILTNSAAVALALGYSGLHYGFALALLAYFLHLTTFSAVFENTKRASGQVLFAVNLLPYVPALLYLPPHMAAYLAALAAVVYFTAAFGKLRTPVGYVAGVWLLASTAIPQMALARGGWPHEYMPVMALHVLYYTAMALYVESRLEFKKLDPWAPLALWLPIASLIIAMSPLLAIPAAEPTVRMVANAARPQRAKTAEEIKKMGWSIFTRSIIFTAVLIATSLAQNL